MKDKVQKIREEIERLLDEYPMSRGLLKHLNKFIDSLPEEPAREDLEIEIENYINSNFSEGCDGGMLSDSEPNLGGVTYCDLANFARHFAEWQENKNAVQSCKNLYAAIKENQEKKFFNDDFEKASYAQGMVDGSIWQKNQMKEALQIEYEKGRFDMREEMMKDAVECIVEDWCGDSPEITIPLNSQDFKNGDRVKTIILKTEQQ